MAKKRREDIGVELYALQQQLAKLQLQLERTHENYNAIAALREQARPRPRVLRRRGSEQRRGALPVSALFLGLLGRAGRIP